jgi:hypothetical protein
MLGAALSGPSFDLSSVVMNRRFPEILPSRGRLLLIGPASPAFRSIGTAK